MSTPRSRCSRSMVIGSPPLSRLWARTYPGRRKSRGRAISSRHLPSLHQYIHRKGEIEMGKIVVSENITLDGVIQDPSGDEGFERGGWVGKVTDREEAGKILADETLGAE